MKLQNLSLIKEENQSIIEIESSGEVYDLHNAADFLGLLYNLENRTLTLSWKYHRDTGIINLSLIFNSVSSLEISPRDILMPEEEDNCLKEIIHSDLFNLSFMSGMSITINAEFVTLYIE